MNGPGSVINITSDLAASDEPKKGVRTTPPPVPEVLPLLDCKDSNTTLLQKDNNTCPTTSEDEDNNANNVGCAGRFRKGLTNVGGWICRQFLEAIINNIADAAWDAIVQCFDDMTELHGDDNDCDQDE